MSVHDVWHVMTRMVGLCLLWHLDSNFKENGTFIFSGLGKAIFRTNKSTRANGFNRMFVIRHGFDMYTMFIGCNDSRMDRIFALHH